MKYTVWLPPRQYSPLNRAKQQIIIIKEQDEGLAATVLGSVLLGSDKFKAYSVKQRRQVIPNDMNLLQPANQRHSSLIIAFVFRAGGLFV